MCRMAIFVFIVVLVLCLPAGASRIPQPLEAHSAAFAASVFVPLVQAEFLLSQNIPIVDDSAAPTPANRVKTCTSVLGSVLLIIAALRIALAFRLEECL